MIIFHVIYFTSLTSLSPKLIAVSILYHEPFSSCMYIGRVGADGEVRTGGGAGGSDGVGDVANHQGREGRGPVWLPLQGQQLGGWCRGWGHALP